MNVHYEGVCIKFLCDTFKYTGVLFKNIFFIVMLFGELIFIFQSEYSVSRYTEIVSMYCSCYSECTL